MATQSTEQKDKKRGMTNTTAGAVGAVVGGMVGAAAGIALSDKNKRKMILQKIEDVKKYVSHALDEIQEMSEDSTDLITEKVTPVKKAKKTTTSRKKTIN